MWRSSSTLYSFGLYSQLVAAGEGVNVDRPVNHLESVVRINSIILNTTFGLDSGKTGQKVWTKIFEKVWGTSVSNFKNDFFAESQPE